MNPVRMGPSVCPTSIIVLKKPMLVPTRLSCESSLARAGVEEVTREKPIPYVIEIRRRRGKSAVNEITIKATAEMSVPATMGVLRPILSESLPIKGFTSGTMAS